MEDKAQICELLLEALKLTRAGADIEKLVYDEKTEQVGIIWRNGYVGKVNVACDSGIAMIRDITKSL